MTRSKPKHLTTVRTHEPSRSVNSRRYKQFISDEGLEKLTNQLPMHLDTFTRITCSRELATTYQRRIYFLNKNHVHGHVTATRYDYGAAELVMWRMR